MHKLPSAISANETREQLRRFAEIEAPPEKSATMPGHIPPPTDWQCSKCGKVFEESSLKIYRSKIAFDNKDLAMCPHCGGPAYNMLQKATIEARDIENEVRTRKTKLRNGIILGMASGIFLLSPSTLTYLLLWIVMFWFGPFAETHLKMKLGAVFAIMWAGFFGSLVITAFSMNHISKLMVWLLITLVLLAAGWIIEKVASMGGSLFFKG